MIIIMKDKYIHYNDDLGIPPLTSQIHTLYICMFLFKKWEDWACIRIEFLILLFQH